MPPPITTASGSSTAVTAAMTRARRSASRSTAARAGATPRRAASKTCRAESREDIPSSTARPTTPRAETLSSNDPHRVPETDGREVASSPNGRYATSPAAPRRPSSSLPLTTMPIPRPVPTIR